MNRKRLLGILPFGLLAVLALTLPASTPASPQTRHLTLDMTQYAFSPGRLRVNEGDMVVIALQATDVVHGFYLDGYGIQQRVEPGIAQQVSFVANRRGKFRYRCSVSCGPMHPFMMGELIVGPNLLLWRAAGMALAALAGVFASLTWTSDSRAKESTI